MESIYIQIDKLLDIILIGIILAVLTLEMCWMGVWEQCAAPVNFDGPNIRFMRDCYNFEEPNEGIIK